MLSGYQEPRFRSYPRASDSAATEAIELAASVGLYLDEWQQFVLSRSLGVREDNKWAAFEVALVVPRQNGKGSIIEARELAGLFLFDEKLLLHSAHEFKTAYEGFRRIVGLIDGSSDLSRKVKIIRTGAGDQSVELKSGQRLRFVSRSRASGRGFSGDVVFLDEAYNLSDEMVAAMLPTMSARPNPQLWYTSSAPVATAESDVLRRLCKRGRAASSRRLAYFEWCADKDDAIDDRDAWAAANPAIDIRISPEFIEAELEALEPEAFARERLGVWSEEDKSNLVIPLAAWGACKDLKSGPTGPLNFALDVSPDRGSATIVVAAKSGRGGVHVEITGDDDDVYDHRPGTGWLVARAAELQGRWGGKVAIAKGSPAWSLEPELVEAGVDLLPVSTEEHAQACGDLYDAIIDGQLKHLGQDELDAAVAGADRRYYGDAWLWSRRTSAADISPLVAVTLAHWAANNLPPRRQGRRAIIVPEVI